MSDATVAAEYGCTIYLTGQEPCNRTANAVK